MIGVLSRHFRISSVDEPHDSLELRQPLATGERPRARRRSPLARCAGHVALALRPDTSLRNVIERRKSAPNLRSPVHTSSERACWPTTGETATSTSKSNAKPATAIQTSPAPAETPQSPTPPPDPNAQLAAYVQQAVAQLDGTEAGLGSDPALTSTEKRHALKMRKGGEKIVPQIGNLVQQQQLESAALPVAQMNALLGKAQALQPLSTRVAAFAKHVDDVIFLAESQSFEMAVQYYALLQRRAVTDAELKTALAPIAAFFAYRHKTAKAPGTPGKRTTKANAKAVKRLKNAAPELLASSTSPAPQAPAGPPAAGAPSGPPAPGNSGGGTPTHS